MTMEKASIWILGGIAVGIMGLAYIALEQGAPALTALAMVLTAGAALITSVIRRDK
jgi:hypothetical protein